MSLWGRIFAAGYDRLLAGTERAGLGALRAELLGSAQGRVLELGAGTGLNLAHYGPGVSELVLTEPEEPMLRRLEQRMRSDGHRAELVCTPAESLPFPDDRFETVVCTLVLCTVRDPRAALGQIARVLVPDGRLLFIEHVRSQTPSLARWQDRLAAPWRAFGAGCNCNRATAELLVESGFELERFERGELAKAPPIVRPLISGSAILAR